VSHLSGSQGGIHYLQTSTAANRGLAFEVIAHGNLTRL